jgi:hypothetical protein
MADYIYNPAESIKQGFQQTQAGIGNIFAQVIAQQQRDYNLAESAFQNIEALKKDVNIFGQKNITSKSNALLGEASSAIRKDGSIDYEKIGKIRQSISDIKDLKTGYDLGAKELERRLQLGIANKDNMESFENYYKQLMGVMADENLVRNPQDMMTKFSEVYDNNLSASRMYQKSFLSANPYTPFSKDITVNGNLVRVAGEIPANMMIDANGKVVPKPPVTIMVNGQPVYKDYVDLEVDRLKASDPDSLVRMKRQAGVAGQYLSDYDLVKSYIDKVPNKFTETQVKSKAQIDTETNQSIITGVGAKYAEKEKIAEIGRIKSATYGQTLQNKIAAATLSSLQEENKSAGSSNEIYFASPRSMVMPLGKNAADVLGKSQKIFYDATKGLLMVSALKDKDTEFNIGENQTVVGGKLVSNAITYRKLDSFKKSVMASALAGIEAKQKPIVKKQIETLFNKAKNGYLVPAYQAKLTAKNKVAANEQKVTLSTIRDLFDKGQFKTLGEGIDTAISQGYKVTNE